MGFFKAIASFFKSIFGTGKVLEPIPEVIEHPADDPVSNDDDVQPESDIIDPAKPVPTLNPSEYRTWIPYAENVHKSQGIKIRSRGEYRYGYPEGLVIHFHSGWALGKRQFWNRFPKKNTINKSTARRYALDLMRWGAKKGYLFFALDLMGNLYQSRPLIKWGYHAGKSYWPSVGRSVSQYFAGIEVLSPGKVTAIGNGQFKTWFGQIFNQDLVRYAASSFDNIQKGYYVMYSYEQEEFLIKFCCDLWKYSPMHNGKKVFQVTNIVGHDSVSPNRKDDPGYSLSVSVPVFQGKVKAALEKEGYVVVG